MRRLEDRLFRWLLRRWLNRAVTHELDRLGMEVAYLREIKEFGKGVTTVNTPSRPG